MSQPKPKARKPRKPATSEDYITRTREAAEQNRRRMVLAADRIRASLIEEFSDLEPQQRWLLVGRAIMRVFQCHFHIGYLTAVETLAKHESKERSR